MFFPQTTENCIKLFYREQKIASVTMPNNLLIKIATFKPSLKPYVTQTALKINTLLHII